LSRPGRLGTLRESNGHIMVQRGRHEFPKLEEWPWFRPMIKVIS